MKLTAIIAALFISILTVISCDKNTPIEEDPPPEEEPEYYDDIGTMWQLTAMPGDETNPSWSPDGFTLLGAVSCSSSVWASSSSP